MYVTGQIFQRLDPPNPNFTAACAFSNRKNSEFLNVKNFISRIRDYKGGVKPKTVLGLGLRASCFDSSNSAIKRCIQIYNFTYRWLYFDKF